MISMSERVAGALAFIKDADDRETWIRVGMAIKSELGKDGYDLWLDWSRKAANFDENAARVAWESFRQGKITIGTLFYLAKQSGWQPGKYQKLAPEELERLRLAAEEAKARGEEEQARRQASAKNVAQLEWERAKACTEHPYLTRKHVQSHRLRVTDWHIRGGNKGYHYCSKALMVPLLDQMGIIWNLQAILPEKPPGFDRDKDFLAGGRKSGLFFTIGEPTETLLIAEGYATAATLHEATGNRTFVAFDCSNLKPVALAVRSMNPGRRIVICADDDRDTPGNPGVTKANAAALAVGGFVSIPEFPEGISGTDWNDLHVYQLGLLRKSS